MTKAELRRYNSSYHLRHKDTKNLSDEKRRAAAAAFAAGHQHTCVRCERPYQCTNACDPVGEGLDNSICAICFWDA